MHVLLVSQFRPPVGRCVIEFPAGLVDAGEEGDDCARSAARRELKEETGYRTDAPVEVSTEMVNDPGLTGANMKLCTVEVALSDDAPEPVAQPDDGEFLERHLVPLETLAESLIGAPILTRLRGRGLRSRRTARTLCTWPCARKSHDIDQ